LYTEYRLHHGNQELFASAESQLKHKGKTSSCGDNNRFYKPCGAKKQPTQPKGNANAHAHKQHALAKQQRASLLDFVLMARPLHSPARYQGIHVSSKTKLPANRRCCATHDPGLIAALFQEA
jgi:hypothetical protein